MTKFDISITIKGVKNYAEAYMFSVGIDLGGTNIAVGITDENYNIIKKGSVPTLAHRPCEEIVADMVALCQKLSAECGYELTDTSGVGIACPGTVNDATGIVEYANNIKFYNFPLKETYSRISKIPQDKIVIGNDANLAALDEAFAGEAKGTSSSVTITLGTGVGSGIIIDGKMLVGCANGGAELGHMVIEKNGRPCSCGRRGCFEAYCSATALVARTKETFLDRPDSLMRQMCDNDVKKVGGKTAFAAMRKGDEAAKEVVDEYIEYLACGIANIINVFQPEMLCIGGGISGEKENLLNPLIPLVEKDVYSADNVLKTKIKIAKLGNDAGIIGAAAAAGTK